jgi:hypothetical protein
MATRAVLQVGLALEESPASLAAELEDISNDRTSVLRFIERIISRVQHRGHKLAVRVDSSTDGSTQFPLGRASVSVAITQASLVATTDTLIFGGANGVVLTWVVASANENEITIGASNTLCGDALVAIINAHSILGGVFFASNASGTVTIQYRGDSRLGGIVGITETGGGQVITGSDFALDTTVAKASESYLFTDGGLR